MPGHAGQVEHVQFSRQPGRCLVAQVVECQADDFGARQDTAPAAPRVRLRHHQPSQAEQFVDLGLRPPKRHAPRFDQG